MRYKVGDKVTIELEMCGVSVLDDPIFRIDENRTLQIEESTLEKLLTKFKNGDKVFMDDLEGVYIGSYNENELSVVMVNGDLTLWPTDRFYTIETITKEDAEKELGKKIID